MTFTTKSIIAGAGLLALTACGDNFNKEAGALIDEGGFGNPTMNNMLAQMCTGQAKGTIIPDAVVALDPKSAPGSPRYVSGSVMCSGHLNGRYAQVIWGGYVSSATAPSRIGGGLAAIEGG
jgi:hypothetical protein